MPLLQAASRPSLRGYLHQEAFFISLGACALLIAKSSNPTSRIASIVYSIGLSFLFGISAFYHRRFWEPRARSLLKRIDHSAIFILIASSFTPVCLLALPEASGHALLVLIWSAAVAGILKSIFWASAPKRLTAFVYVVVGCLAVPYLGQMYKSLGAENLSLIVVGGVFYIVGAVFYAIRKPNLLPEVFGYHELFHLFTIVAATLHFVVIYQLIT